MTAILGRPPIGIITPSKRDDLRRFATGLVQVEDLTSRYVDDDVSPEDAEQTKSRNEQLEDRAEDSQTEITVDVELNALEYSPE